MHKKRALISILLTSLAISGNGLHAANSATEGTQSSSVTTFKVSSRLVVLDVAVHDKNHKSVSGLKKEDFTILENGEVQRIRSFEPASEHRVPRNISVNSTSDLRKAAETPVTVIVIDELSTPFDETGYARYSLKKFLGSQPEKLAQPTALMVVNSNRFLVLHDFTQSRDSLLATINGHLPEFAWRLTQGNGAEAGERLAIALNSIQQVARAYSGHPGRKNLIWLGRGFPSVNVQDLPAEDAQKVTDSVQRTINTLLDAHVALYTIDPTANTSSVNDTNFVGEMEGPNDISSSQDPGTLDPFSDNVNFGLIAPASGGRAYRAMNSLNSEIDSSVIDGSHYYTITYAPSNPSDDTREFRNITIKMTRPDLVASARTGYYDRISPAADPSTETRPVQESRQLLTLDLSSAAQSDMQYIGLPVSVEKGSKPGTFILHVDTKALSWNDLPNGDRESEVTILSAALDKKSKFLSHHAFEMVAHVKAADISKSLRQTCDFSVVAEVPQRAARVRFIVRDAVTGHIGSAELGSATFHTN